MSFACAFDIFYRKNFLERDNVAKSKTISLFLLDGTANGRIKCSINSRNEIIYKIPRKDLTKCKGLDTLDNAGVYMLIGEEDGNLKIYVGQAGGRKNGKGLLNRLSEHDRSPDKNFWSEAILLTMADNSFGATEISWLEHKFCDLAIKAARCSVMNGNIIDKKVTKFLSRNKKNLRRPQFSATKKFLSFRAT